MTRFNLSIAILACSLATSSIAVAADVRYRLTLLDPSLTAAAEVTGLNNRGEVVGNDGNGRAFLWNGQLVDLARQLDPESEFVSRASDISNHSDIIGWYQDPQGVTHNFLLQRGQVIPIQVIGDRLVFPEDINDRRQVIGTVSDAQFRPHLFVWRRGEAELLGPLPGGNFLFGAQINDRGVIAGQSDSPEGSRATIWQDGAATAIGPVGTHAVGINNRGHVIVMADEAQLASIWKDGVLSPLSPLSGGNGETMVFDINNRGAAVGLSAFPDGTTRATLWERDGAPIDITTRIDSNDPLRPFVVRLIFARQINDRGQMVALGLDTRRPDGAFQHYLLDPVH